MLALKIAVILAIGGGGIAWMLLTVKRGTGERYWP